MTHNKNGSTHVSCIANSIGFALAERGVQLTADDVLAAAEHVVDQFLDRLISVQCDPVLVGATPDGWALYEQGQEITYVVRRAPE